MIKVLITILLIVSNSYAQDLKTVSELAQSGEWEKLVQVSDKYLMENKIKLPNRSMIKSKDDGKPVAEYYFIMMYRTLADVGDHNEIAFKNQIEMIKEVKEAYEGTAVGNGVLIGLTSTLGSNWENNEVPGYSEEMYQLAYENEKKWSTKPLNMTYLYASALYNNKKYDDSLKLYGTYLKDTNQQIKEGNYKYVIGSVFGSVLCYIDKNDDGSALKYIEIGLKISRDNDDQESIAKLNEMKGGIKK